MRIACIVTTRFPMIVRQKALRHEESTIPAGVKCPFIILERKKRLITLTQSSISMTFCKAAIDPAIFPSPHVFLPERWTDGWQEGFDYERYVLPFGRGSRVCIGQQ